MSFTANFIGVQTGIIEASNSEKAEFSAKACEGGETAGGIIAKALIKDRVEFGPKEKMLQDAAKVAISSFIKKIAPHYEMERLVLKDADDDASLISFRPSPQEKTISEGMKAGCEFAKGNFWDKAIISWEGVLKVKPTSAAAIYNIALAHEARGDLFKAKEGYDKAVGLKPGDSAYISAAARTEQKIKEREELDKQLKGRVMAKKAERPTPTPPPPPVAPAPAFVAPPPKPEAAPPPSILAPKEAQAAVPPSPSAAVQPKVTAKPVVVEKPPVTYLVTTSDCNVRSEPNVKSEVITTLKKGQKVEKLDQLKNWCNIKLLSGEKGWIHKDLVKETE